MKYEKFPVPCDLTVTSMRDAAQRILDALERDEELRQALLSSPVFDFTLHVSPKSAIYSRKVLTAASADVRDNPFAPYINLEIEQGFAEDEWCLSLQKNFRAGTEGRAPVTVRERLVGGIAFGSEGAL